MEHIICFKIIFLVCFIILLRAGEKRRQKEPRKLRTIEEIKILLFEHLIIVKRIRYMFTCEKKNFCCSYCFLALTLRRVSFLFLSGRVNRIEKVNLF